MIQTKVRWQGHIKSICASFQNSTLPDIRIERTCASWKNVSNIEVWKVPNI